MLPPSQRGHLIEGIERVMTQFREALDDEMVRRLQEEGKFPPGLPKQDA